MSRKDALSVGYLPNACLTVNVRLTRRFLLRILLFKLLLKLALWVAPMQMKYVETEMESSDDANPD